ncbi:unnamed protein product [Callosobruchus maculatus]|uniref:Uncharacterized protein n=1 Tax=Callosobruchus maculatus TaxID=64391 RepID=A0A653D9I6_CALMS|nr:unnamed protein product [Callosobruchus maculatus]
METLKASNRVKFSSMVNLPITDEPSVPPEEISDSETSAVPTLSNDTENQHEDTSKSSCHSVEYAGVTKLRKKNSIIEKLRQLVQPKKSEIDSSTEQRPQNKDERRCTSARKGGFWKSSKLKVPVAN